MQMSLSDALESIKGTSDLADAIIHHRFGDMVSESAAQNETSLTDVQYEEILDDVMADRYDAKNPNATRQLMLVILRLLDDLASAGSTSSVPEEEKSDEASEQDVAKLAEFREAIQGARIGDLRCYYTENLFRNMKRETRSMVAQALVEYSHSLGKEPDRLWVSLMQNNGIM